MWLLPRRPCHCSKSKRHKVMIYTYVPQKTAIFVTGTKFDLLFRCPRYMGNMIRSYLFAFFSTLFEPVSSKWYKLARAPIEDSDQPTLPRSLIRVFDGCSFGSQGLKFSSGGTKTLIRLRGYPNCSEFSLYAHANVYLMQNTRLGAQWLSGRVLDSRPKGRGFEPYQRHCVVVLEQDTFILA